MTQHPLLGIYPKGMKTGTQVLVQQCSQQHYSKEPKGVNTPSVYKTDEQIKCDVYTQWNIQPQKGIKFSHLMQYG